MLASLRRAAVEISRKQHADQRRHRQDLDGYTPTVKVTYRATEPAVEPVQRCGPEYLKVVISRRHPASPAPPHRALEPA